jgi:hypothetical protein
VPDLQLALPQVAAVAIVLAGQPLLQQAVEDDEEVARAHLAHLELGQPFLAVDPAVRLDRVAIAADDGLQWQFDRQVEVVGEQRLQAAITDRRYSEGVGGVVVSGSGTARGSPMPRRFSISFGQG